MTAISKFRAKNEVAFMGGILNASDAENFKKCKEICKKIDVTTKNYLILVNVNTQKMYLFEKEKLIKSYSISTAKNGVGQEEGTGKTPLGLHHVEAKIGEGADPYAIFESRLQTGKKATPQDERAYIVGRILWLSGLEPQWNQGYKPGENDKKINVDSHDRYIYTHGTNDLRSIGKPTSGGCVRMDPNEVVELFDKVPEKTPVYIYI